MPFYAILDFEATCWQENNNHEIIEWPTVIIDAETHAVLDEFRVFVKPRDEPILSEFCKSLTGITQEQVDDGMPFPEALKAHTKFMSAFPNALFVTCGGWDLGTMIQRDAGRHKVKLPSLYKKWFNIKKAFEAEFPEHQGSKAMPVMLEQLGLSLEGRHHSGLDDSRNIGKIAVALLKRNGAGKALMEKALKTN